MAKTPVLETKTDGLKTLETIAEEYVKDSDKLAAKILLHMNTGKELLSKAFRERDFVAFSRVVKAMYKSVKEAAKCSELQTLVVAELDTYDEIMKRENK